MRWLRVRVPRLHRRRGRRPASRAIDPTGYGSIFYFTGAFEKFAPWNLDEATINRYDLLLAGK